MKPLTHLRSEQLSHLVRAAAGITNETILVLIGTGAVIAQLKSAPADLMLTRRIELYPPGASDPAAMSRLIDATIGEGSPFDDAFGYYAHGVEQDAAVLPYDWRLRAQSILLPDAPGVTCVCPDVNDVALSRLAAWQENDRRWLDTTWKAGLLTAGTMRERVQAISDPRAPGATELEQRIGALEAGLPASGALPDDRAAGKPSPQEPGSS